MTDRDDTPVERSLYGPNEFVGGMKPCPQLSFDTYDREFLDHRPTVQTRLYLHGLITEFNQQLEAWMRDWRARRHSGECDAVAIGPLDQVLAVLPAPGAAT